MGLRLVALLLLCALSVGAEPNLRATALPQGGYSLSWNASPTAGVTYNLLRRDGPCSAATGAFNKVNTAPIPALTFVDNNAPAGKVCYVVRAVDIDAAESADSNRVSLPRPEAPTNLRTP